MEILDCHKVDAKKYNIDSSVDIYLIHVLIDDLPNQASEMIRTIMDESWILKLSPVDKMSFEARAKRTIEKLVDDIFRKVSNNITTEFGQYMVSMSAQTALESALFHKRVPLAELFKEKVTGNPGFDFHTESHTTLVAFGEAKFSEYGSPYSNALMQISSFISLGKDVAELTDLCKFVSKKAIENAMKNNKAYIAAFSLNAENTDRVLDNVLSSNHIKPILQYPELYLIGVEINDKAPNCSQ